MRELEKLTRAEAMLREARPLIIEAGARTVRVRLDTLLGEIAKIQKRSQFRTGTTRRKAGVQQ